MLQLSLASARFAARPLAEYHAKFTVMRGGELGKVAAILQIPNNCEYGVNDGN